MSNSLAFDREYMRMDYPEPPDKILADGAQGKSKPWNSCAAEPLEVDSDVTRARYYI